MKMAVIFIVRVYATYSANKVILYFMIALLATKEVIVIVRYSPLPLSTPSPPAAERARTKSDLVF